MSQHTAAQHGEMLSVVKVAEILDCSRAHVYRLIAAKQLSCVDISIGPRAKTRIPLRQLEKFIESRTTIQHTTPENE